MSKVLVYTTFSSEIQKLKQILKKYGFEIHFFDWGDCFVLDFDLKKFYSDDYFDYSSARLILEQYYHDIPGRWNFRSRMENIREMHIRGEISRERMVYILPQDNMIISDMVEKMYLQKKKLFEFKELNIEIL